MRTNVMGASRSIVWATSRFAAVLGAMFFVVAAGCDMGNDAACDNLMPGDFSCTINGRSYQLHVPQNLASPAPLVVDAHGFTESSAIQRGKSGYLQLSDQLGFVVVFPQGNGNAFNAQGQCCDFLNVTDDVGFFRTIVSRTRAAGNIDPQRIFAVGFSNGGSMAHTMACTTADIFSAIGPVSFSLAGPGGPINTASVAAACTPSKPVTMIQLHGTADGLANFNAGLLDSLPAPASLAAWSMVDRCDATPGPVQRFGPATSCEVRTAGCAGGARVGLCTVTGGGHLNIYSFTAADAGMSVAEIVYPMLLDAVEAQIAAGNSR
jgi:polyhydroxybutyrate depolymerase